MVVFCLSVTSRKNGDSSIKNNLATIKMKILILLFFSTILILGCTNSKDYSRYDFDSVEKISTTNIPIDDSILMRYPYRLAKNDSLTFVLDLHAPEYFVHVFSSDELKYHRSLFKAGQGPDEFISISNLQLDGDSLYIFGSGNQIIISHVDDMYGGRENHRRIRLPVDGFGFLSKGLKFGDDFCFPVFNVASDGRILQFNNQGEFMNSFGKIELSDEKASIESAT